MTGIPSAHEIMATISSISVGYEKRKLHTEVFLCRVLVLELRSIFVHIDYQFSVLITWHHVREYFTYPNWIAGCITVIPNLSSVSFSFFSIFVTVSLISFGM